MSQLSSQIHTIKRGNKNKMRKYSLLAFSNSKSIAWSLKKNGLFFLRIKMKKFSLVRLLLTDMYYVIYFLNCNWAQSG